MKQYLLSLLLILPFLMKAQQDEMSYVVVSDIVVSGNNETKVSIIYRELTFEIGDTIPAQQWENELRVSNENILNTTLFNFVTVDYEFEDSSDKAVIVYIDVVERWYLWLYPYVAYSDRNLNAWYEADDITRFSYGVEM